MVYDRNEESYKDVFKPTELYDLRDDVSETNNIIDKHPEVVAELKEVLEKYIKEGRSTEGVKQKNQPDKPTGDWEQIAFMDDYKDYVKSLNVEEVDKKDEDINSGVVEFKNGHRVY